MSFDEEFEAIGEAEVRRMLLERDNDNSVMLSYAPAWLALKDAERIARIEARESSAISEAKRANRLALYATIIAIIGTINSTKSEIYALISMLIP